MLRKIYALTVKSHFVDKLSNLSILIGTKSGNTYKESKSSVETREE